MTRIEKAPYGFKLTFGGFIQKDEMDRWVEDSRKALVSASGKFGVFVDMRTLKPLPAEAQPSMVEGQKLYKVKGMERSVVILANAITTSQFKRIAKETGIYAWERYLDASKTQNWEAVGRDWIERGVDPDQN